MGVYDRGYGADRQFDFRGMTFIGMLKHVRTCNDGVPRRGGRSAMDFNPR